MGRLRCAPTLGAVFQWLGRIATIALLREVRDECHRFLLSEAFGLRSRCYTNLDFRARHLCVHPCLDMLCGEPKGCRSGLSRLKSCSAPSGFIVLDFVIVAVGTNCWCRWSALSVKADGLDLLRRQPRS